MSLLGLEFELSGGGTRTLDFRDGEPVDLSTSSDGDPMRMFTDETLDAGDYTGVRLLFDGDFDATVVDTEGGEFPLTLQDGAFADVNFAYRGRRTELARVHADARPAPIARVRRRE